MSVAECRNRDATSLKDANRLLASLYFHGFAAECFAKAILARSDTSPAATPKGHDLMRLLEEAGFRRQALNTELRAAAENRDVSLRYQADQVASVTAESVAHMNQLASWIERRARRITTRAQAKAVRPRS